MGYWSNVWEHLHLKMTEAQPRLKKADQSAIVSFEWMAHVHEIFNNILMNVKTILIDANNIQVFETRLKNSMDYFDSLRQRQLERREEGIENWDKTFLDLGKTLCNIRQTCKGFIAYC